MTGREVFQGHDGHLRVRLRPGEGEFVYAACDVIIIAAALPHACASCGHDRMETLTSVAPPTWPLEMPRG